LPSMWAFALETIPRMKLRLGVAGLGEAWERRHRTALRALADRFEVKAIYDQVRQRAELAAAEFNAAAVDGYHALTAREDIDAIFVSSSQWSGPLPVLAACRAGKSVYFGSGVDMELSVAEGVKSRVAEAGIAFMVEFPRRQAPATLRLKELIATRLGMPRLLFCHRRLPIVEPANHLRDGSQPTTRQELVELVDWCRYVVGKAPRWVTGVAHHGGGSGSPIEYRMMSLDFSDSRPGTGPIAQLSCGRYVPGRWSEAVSYRPVAAMQISCEHGIAFIDLPATLVWFDEAGRHHESLESERPVGEQLLMQFFRAVTSLVTKTCDLDDAYQSLRIVEQAEDSALEGRRVALE